MVHGSERRLSACLATCASLAEPNVAALGSKVATSAKNASRAAADRISERAARLRAEWVRNSCELVVPLLPD